MMIRCCVFGAVLFAVVPYAAGAETPTAGTSTAVSYHAQVRPILQAHCHGCHQPAKAGGDYVMTDFAALLRGGESGSAAIVPGKPDEACLIAQITPQDGRAEMPQGRPPLTPADIGLIRQWIHEGAHDDTPDNARARYDAEHPPLYTRPPVITSLDFSPDGSTLAVAAFHEVLLFKVDGSARQARLVGLAERIESVRFSPDGQRLAVVGGLPARMGEVQIWNVADGSLSLSLPVTWDTIYGGAWSPDGALLAVGGGDNVLRAFAAATGEQVVSMAAHDDWIRGVVFAHDGKSIFSAGRDMTVKMTDVATQRFVGNVTTHTPGVLRGGMLAIARHPQRNEVLVGSADGAPKLFQMEVKAAPAGGGNPNQIREYEPLRGRVFDVRFSPDGSRFFAGSSLDGQGQVRCYETDAGKASWSQDVPESPVYAVACSPDGATVAVAGADGQIRLLQAADGALRGKFPAVEIPVDTSPPALSYVPDFIRDVNPVLSRLGCNQGTCHGAAKGKNGFKLSLRGYDALFDMRSLADDLASRRVNTASPDDSLMLLKATAAVPHQGGQLIAPGTAYYQILREWIAHGANLNVLTPRVVRIEIQPQQPVLPRAGDTQPMQVVATYADGATRDVTREAFIESGNTEVATANRNGVMLAVRRGEAPVLARYEGAYAATTLTVMGDRSGFVWQPPDTWGRIDELVAAKWERMKIRPADLCTDAEFLRRAYLDLTGLPPTADDVRAFLNDQRDTRQKRADVVSKLIGSGDFIEHWTNKWCDLLQVNRKYLGPEGAAAFHDWVRAEVAANTPYDALVRKLLTAAGSNRENPAASYFKILRDPLTTTENSTHLFLGVRFNCNKCHDHPFERWTQDQYYQAAAYFAQFELAPDPAAGDKKIEGTAVADATPLYEIVRDKAQGDVRHDRTQAVVQPQFPFSCQYEPPGESTRRQDFAAWLTSPDNPYFARSYVNRLWSYLLGVGVIEPIDDIRAGNPPTNAELLDFLTAEFVRSGFNMRHMLQLICTSRTYQLSLETNAWNEDDQLNYSHAIARRLPAEVLYDAICRVTGSQPRIPGVAPGTRAEALPDSGVNLPDAFLTSLGRPARESACECERSSGLQLGPVMALISGPSVDSAIADPHNELPKLVSSMADDRQLVAELFLRILNRTASASEVEQAIATLQAIPREHDQLVAELQRCEQELAPVMAERESRRQSTIAQATAALTAYEQQIAAREAELDRQHAQGVASAEAAVKEYEQQLPELLSQWEGLVKQPIAWTTLKAAELSSSNQAQLVQREDLSVFAQGPNGKTTYKFAAASDLQGLTGVKLEVLTEDSLPQKGPGRADNGNFVLTELRVEWNPQAEPNQKQAVVLQHAHADFSQAGYDVQTAIDGQKAENGNGWATSPQTGQDRTAVFEMRDNVGESPGLLTFWLDQEFADGKHTIGRFRVSITNSPRPVARELLPRQITDILAIAAEGRSDQQRKELVEYYRGHVDAELKRRDEALAAARKPRPVDPQLQSLRDALAAASQPVPIDPKLAQLRNDVELCQKQLQNSRLTFAQDLAWALINNPAFLFNH